VITPLALAHAVNSHPPNTNPTRLPCFAVNITTNTMIAPFASHLRDKPTFRELAEDEASSNRFEPNTIEYRKFAK